MNYSKFRITLDIHKHQSQVSIPVMYGDTAVQLLVTLTDGGLPYVIGKSCWAQFVAKKPDGSEPLVRKCIIENSTVIRLDFDNGIADVAGVYDCEIRLYGAEGKLTSPCFTMVVDPRVAADYVGDDTENNFIDQIGTTMAEFQRAEEARENAEAERVKAEEERQNTHNALVADVGLEVFDDGSIILKAFNSTGDEVSQSFIKSIGTDTIADQAVTSKKIAPGAVKNSHLAWDAVSTAELCDGAVTFDKLDLELGERLYHLEDSAFEAVSYNAATGVLTFKAKNGGEKSVDLPLELLVKSGYFDEGARDVVLVLANGGEVRIPFDAYVDKVTEELNSLVADVSLAFDNGSIILKAFNSTGGEVSQSGIELPKYNGEVEDV